MPERLLWRHIDQDEKNERLRLKLRGILVVRNDFFMI
jgi:hypothetical protein